MMIWQRGANRSSWTVRIVIVIGFWLLGAWAPVDAATAPPITTVAFTPDGTAVVAGSQAGLEVRSWPELVLVARLTTELSNIHDAAFSPDGKLLAAAGGEPGVNGAVELYRWPQQDLIRRDVPHDDVVYSVAWRSDGEELALASGDQRVGILSATRVSPPHYVEGHSRTVLAAEFLPGNRGLLSGGVDATIRLWDVAARISRETFNNHTRTVNDLKMRPSRDDQELPMLASAGDDRTVRFWHPTVSRLIRFARLESAPMELAWSADGLVLWAACRDGRLRGIDPGSAIVTSSVPGIEGVAYALAVAPDGSVVIAGTRGQLRRIGVRKSAGEAGSQR